MGGAGVFNARGATIGSLMNAGGATIRGGDGGSASAGGTGGAGVANSGTIRTLTNNGTISGGNGGAGSLAGGAGGAGIANSGAITTLTNRGRSAAARAAPASSRRRGRRRDYELRHDHDADQQAGRSTAAPAALAIRPAQWPGGAGVWNSGTITTLTNSGTISGGQRRRPPSPAARAARGSRIPARSRR